MSKHHTKRAIKHNRAETLIPSSSAFSATLTSFTGQGYNPLLAALDTFLLAKEAMRCTPKTLEHYRYTVGSFVAWLQSKGISTPQDITANHIRGYLVEMQQRGLRATTQHAHARGIKAWLNWLVNEGELQTSPMHKVPMPKLDKEIPRAFTVEEVQRLLAACDRTTTQGLRDYAIILCLLDSGLRREEFCRLRLCDVNLKTGVVFVRYGKGGKQRQTRFGARARAALLRYLAAQNVAPEEPLFGLRGRGLQIMLYRLGRKAGVAHCSPHTFRRTFALWMLRDGVDLHSLRVLMGHSDLSVLQRYLDLGVEDIERAHVAHSPADHYLSTEGVSPRPHRR